MSRFFLAVLIAFVVVGWWCSEAWFHRRRMAGVTWRVHVNGIRGKSTVTRLIAGAFRQSGIPTIAKSTGTAAAVIGLDGEDESIVRSGPPTILEQIRIVRSRVDRGVEALVVECMALKPAYQRASERHIVRSNIGVLTNVRHDHQDVMGESLAEIARSLLETCPWRGVLVTAEADPDLLEIIRAAASERRTEVLVVDPESVSDEELSRFEFVSFKENVAIGLAVADLAGIDRATALDGMVAAGPDPGVLRVSEAQLEGTRVTWANLFAVNDRESVMTAMERLDEYRSPETVTVGILNNRGDREQRAIQFADIAANDIRFDRVVTFGALERQVTRRLVDSGFDPGSVINLGEDLNPSIDEMMSRMVGDQRAEHVLLVGMVNVHTEQADLLMHHLAERAVRGRLHRPPTKEVRELGALTDALIRTDRRESSELASAIGYELAHGVDRDGRGYVIASESRHAGVGRGWRTLVVADHGHPIVVEIPSATATDHQIYKAGLQVFRDLQARALVLAGTHRKAPVESTVNPTVNPASLQGTSAAPTEVEVVVSAAHPVPLAVAINLSDGSSRSLSLSDSGLSTDLLRRIDLADLAEVADPVNLSDRAHVEVGVAA